MFQIDFRRHKTLREFSKDYQDLIKRIYRAEVNAEVNSDKSASNYLEDYAEDFLSFDKKSKRVPMEMRKIASELRKGKRRAQVYRGLISDDIVTFLETSEHKGVKASMIFQRYAPIKEMGESVKRKVRGKLVVPLAILLVFIGIIEFIMGTFKEIHADGTIAFSDLSLFIMNYFLPVVLIYALIFAYLLVIIPDKLPMLKKVFGEINGMLALASMDIMHYISYDAGSMILPIKRQFKIKRNHPRRDIFGLTDILYHEGFISKDQGSELRRTRDLEEGIKIALKEKKEIVENLGETVQDAVKEITTLLLALPLFMVLEVLSDMMMSATTLLQGVGTGV